MTTDERIPSVRDLAVEIEVNPNTVMRTYKHLQDNDIIYNKRGIGYFIKENAYEKALKLKKNEFISSEIPLLFKTMKALNIQISDLEDLYQKYIKKN